MKVQELVYNKAQSDKSGRVSVNFWLYASVSYLFFLFSPTYVCIKSSAGKKQNWTMPMCIQVS